ncbi:MAG: hypothetical protein AAB922_08000 [Patescibacteria group bacterium]
MATGVEYKSWFFLIVSVFFFLAAGRAMNKKDSEPRGPFDL